MMDCFEASCSELVESIVVDCYYISADVTSKFP